MGRNAKYNEETIVVSSKVPKNKVADFKKKTKEILKTYEKSPQPVPIPEQSQDLSEFNANLKIAASFKPKEIEGVTADKLKITKSKKPGKTTPIQTETQAANCTCVFDSTASGIRVRLKKCNNCKALKQ